MPLSPIPEENGNNSPRMPFQSGMKATKNTNTYKRVQEKRPENLAFLSSYRATAANYVPSNATRKAARKSAKKKRQANARSAKAAAKSAKKRSRKNRR